MAKYKVSKRFTPVYYTDNNPNRLMSPYRSFTVDKKKKKKYEKQIIDNGAHSVSNFEASKYWTEYSPSWQPNHHKLVRSIIPVFLLLCLLVVLLGIATNPLDLIFGVNGKGGILSAFSKFGSDIVSFLNPIRFINSSFHNFLDTVYNPDSLIGNLLGGIGFQFLKSGANIITGLLEILGFVIGLLRALVCFIINILMIIFSGGEWILL